ncbi:MAG: pyridoxal-phosphate dependent enzyme, partial [Candidatus Buchananbacteria bacterium]
MDPISYFQCMKEECGLVADLLAERKFRCPDCQSLFDVRHKIAKRYPWQWQDEFDRLLTSNSSASDVWRFKRWIMPGLADRNIVSLGEGKVPIVPAGKRLREWIGGDLDLWLMLEGKGPTGAFKDFGMTVLVSLAKAAGIKHIACISTGDTSASLAAYCAAAGITCTVILPAGKVTDEQILQVKLFGAKVILVPGSFDDCIPILNALVSQYGVYPGNSLNPARIEGHQATVFLAAQFFGWQLPDWFVVMVGNGSNGSSVGKALRFMKSQGFKVPTKILGCQSTAAQPLYRSWLRAGGSQATKEAWTAAYRPMKVRDTIATAARIANPVSWQKIVREITASGGAMALASEPALYKAVEVCASDGHFVCPQ